MSRYTILVALLLSSGAHAESTWTHLPDGRWMFVDPKNPPASSQMCDFEHHCYGGEDNTPPTAKVAPPVKPRPSYPTITEVPLETEPCPSQMDYGPQHAWGTGCDNWPLGSDADLDCRQGYRR